MLPITAVLPDIARALAEAGVAVLQAPPGAGKTTAVPSALLTAPWMAGRRIVMLEPRRVAARAAARYIASQLRERVGQTIGYRIRRDVQVSASTRIEVVTEGVLTRQLMHDPGLDGVGLVILDEFHERSLHADLALALVLEARQVLRPDLRVLVMSATLDGAPVTRLLGEAPLISTEGRQYPVVTHYRPDRHRRHVSAQVASAVLEALEADQGDVLAFLPGTGEILRTAELLGAYRLDAEVLPLHGSQSAEVQDRALRPMPPGRRKVVLATNVAETSLTIDGVRVVVDSGLVRVPRYSPRTGMTALVLTNTSRASADQRRGRAGRTAPGTCYRLWDAGEDLTRLARTPPEILESDLAGLALDLAVMGHATPDALAWLDPPPAGAFAEARELLVSLGALDTAGRVTAHGRDLAQLGVHPRLAHALVRGRELGLGVLAADVVALLGERDVLPPDPAHPDADLRRRVEALRSGDPAADRGLLARVREESRHLRRRLALGADAPAGSVEDTGLVVALAYPDRVARRRDGTTDRYLLRGGTGAVLEPQALCREEWIVVADLDGRGRDRKIRLAAPLAEAELERMLPGQVSTREECRWDEKAGLVARRVESLGAIELRSVPDPAPPDEAATAAVLVWVRARGLAALGWRPAASSLRSRMAFLHHVDPEWPDVSDEALLGALETWLAPLLGGVRRPPDLESLPLERGLAALLDWEQRPRLDVLAPERLEVPSGSRLAIDYGDPARPTLPVRVQEVFGWSDTPVLAGGRVPLTLQLLSPARRPVQVTQDLAGFWRSGWHEVRKELRGRYPKHDWPEDPLAAVPHRGARRRT